jgi:hypothetical protein
MKDLQTVFEDNLCHLDSRDFDVMLGNKNYILAAMKEYGEEYAKKYVEAITIELSQRFPNHSIFNHTLNIKLPEHE